MGNNTLTKVVLGKYVTTIGEKAFSGISEKTVFYMKGNALARKKAARKIKKSGYAIVSVKKL